MGAMISSFIIEPILGIGIVALAVMAIIKENQDQKTSAKWFAVGSTALTIVLIVLNIVLAILLL